MWFKKPVRRYHRIDAWRGYYVPALAIVGASDTGMGYDSPCPSDEVLAELNRFRKEALRPLGIRSQMRTGRSSNIFCAKRWLVVKEASFNIAASATLKWLEDHGRDTFYIHDAELDQVIEKEG